MKIIYESPQDAVSFDIEKYYNSLNRYGEVKKETILEEISKLHYDPMHYSVLVELGVKLLPSDESAKAYYEDHKDTDAPCFERLRRITGYLVGSLERWNDGKKAEERERVKHGVFTPEEKLAREVEKETEFMEQQNEYRK